MQKKWLKDNQSGRSLVEMLGVLAIIGILSISGIAGYKYAMNRYRISETYDEVSVTVSGGRTWPILEHYGPMTELAGVETVSTVAYVVPVREVVSKVNYRSNITAEEAGIEEPNDAADAMRFYNERREYESFNSKVLAPVWTRAETPNAWSIRITGLSYELCEMIVTKRELGYDYVYVALRDDTGSPLDPHYHDFPNVTENKYTNEDIKNHDNVKKLCEIIDPKHSSIPPVYKFIQGLSKLNKKDSGISSVGNDCSVGDGLPSVRCLAFGARVENEPLQTLVLYWHKATTEAPVQPLCLSGTPRDINGDLTQYCCETEADGIWREEGGTFCCCACEGNDDTPVQNIAGQLRNCRLTGRDVEGNAQDLCTPPAEPSCCIKGTPWFEGEVRQITETCFGDCPETIVSPTQPNQEEAKLCCEAPQLGGRWVLKPGNRASTQAPLSSSPKDGPALCCASSADVLTLNGTNKASCENKRQAPWGMETINIFNSSTVTLATAGGSCVGDVDPEADVTVAPTECFLANPVATDIYGSENNNCCAQKRDNGFIQVQPFPVSSKTVNEQCCLAMNAPGMTTPQKTGMRFVTGAGNTGDCETECCDATAINASYAQYTADPTGKFSGNIFVNYEGAPKASMCCQVLGAGDSSKFMHPSCCETDLANVSNDFAGKWEQTKTIGITSVNERGECSVDQLTYLETCCHPNQNGKDIYCNTNLLCCDATDNYDNLNNRASRDCCPLIFGHYWDETTNSCVPCGKRFNGACGDPNICEEVDDGEQELCCIKNQGEQCFEPYAWDPRTGDIYLSTKCCSDCPAGIRNNKFLGFSKEARERKDRIIGNCGTGFRLIGG